MAPTKLSKAIKAISCLGFPEETVKSTLQDLLKATKWKLIEDGNYSMLVDAILHRSEQKQKEKMNEPESSIKSILKRRTAGSTAGPSVTFMECDEPISGAENNAQGKDFISDVCPSPEEKFPVSVAGILQDENCSCSSRANLLFEVMDVEDEFDALFSSPRRESDDKNDEPGNGSSTPNQLMIIQSEHQYFIEDITKGGEEQNISLINEVNSEEMPTFKNDEPGNGSSTPNQLMIIQSEHQYFIEDITKGVEEQNISLINEVNSEEMPTFNYMRKSTPYLKAHVEFSLVHISEKDCCNNCSIDCLSSASTCPCAKKSGGEFAYRTGGVVNHGFIDKCMALNHKSPQQKLSFCEVCPLERSKKMLTAQCKGHVFREFIKECWYKCDCHNSCGNRTVQRGITAKLQVFMTPEGKGWGLRTLEDLPRGAFICEFVGEILTTTELAERTMKRMAVRHSYSVILDAGWRSGGGLKDEDALCLDGTSYGNVARFINHRCHDANMTEIPVEVETPNHHYYHVAFFTTREVKAMEELTWDYGINFGDDSQPWKVFQCCCGGNFCRGKKPGKRRRYRYRA